MGALLFLGFADCMWALTGWLKGLVAQTPVNCVRRSITPSLRSASVDHLRLLDLPRSILIHLVTGMCDLTLRIIPRIAVDDLDSRCSGRCRTLGSLARDRNLIRPAWVAA